MSFVRPESCLPISSDSLFGGRVTLRQGERGHRVGTDAVLLAAAAPAATGLVVDAGAGVGAVGIAVALRMPLTRVELLDFDPLACALARENLALNGLESRGSVVAVDLLSGKARREAGVADGRAELVLVNPPFYESPRVRASPDRGKQRAHVLSGEGNDTLLGWVKLAIALAAPDGRVLIVHRADRLDALLSAFAGRAGGLTVLPIHPRAGEAATRVLIAGRKGSRAPVRLLSGLILHREDGAFTDQAQAINRGEALISGL